MKKILFILLALSFTLIACKKDDGPEECSCTVEARDENNQQYGIQNFPIDCETRLPLLDEREVPEGHFVGGCI